MFTRRSSKIEEPEFDIRKSCTKKLCFIDLVSIAKLNSILIDEYGVVFFLD